MPGPAPRGGARQPTRKVKLLMLLEVDGLRVGYGHVSVIEDLSLRVEAGQVVALLGPNGAGKTTTLLGLSGALPIQGGGGVELTNDDFAQIIAYEERVKARTARRMEMLGRELVATERRSTTFDRHRPSS